MCSTVCVGLHRRGADDRLVPLRADVPGSGRREKYDGAANLRGCNVARRRTGSPQAGPPWRRVERDDFGCRVVCAKGWELVSAVSL